MAQKKDFKFDYELVELAQFHFALSHPARIKIITILRTVDGLPFYKIAQDIPLSPTTVTQHIAILKRSRLLLPIELPDATVGYCLNHESFGLLRQVIGMSLNEAA